MDIWVVLIGLAGVLAGFVWVSRKTQQAKKQPHAPQPLPTPEKPLPPVIDPEPTMVLQPPQEASPTPAVEWAAEPTRTVVLPQPEPESVPAQQAPLADEALKKGLAKTHVSLWGKLRTLLGAAPALNDALFEQLEEVLLTADVGIHLTTQLLERLKKDIQSQHITSSADITSRLKQYMQESLAAVSLGAGSFPPADAGRPYVVLCVGVNGVGKTTTLGKLASLLTQKGLHVVLGAGDTFRAAAAQQLGVWAERTGADIIQGAEGADPSSVLFNTLEHAKNTQADVVLADTAGRLHTKTSLMDEIKKVKRVVGKAREGAPDEVWLVVDATTGQNALQQAKEFHQALGLTGVILTKLDGTAKGGIVMAIVDAIKVPVKFIGIGEQASDLRPFNPESFVAALFEEAA